MPELLEYLWIWFLRLSKRRGGGFGPAPLTFQEIDSWARLTGLRLTPWEVEQLEALDDLYLKVTAERNKDK